MKPPEHIFNTYWIHTCMQLDRCRPVSSEERPLNLTNRDLALPNWRILNSYSWFSCFEFQGHLSPYQQLRMVGCSPLPGTRWRLQQTCSTGAVSTGACTEYVCVYICIYIYIYVHCPQHTWAVRAHNARGHSVERYSQHDSPGPQHPPSSSQAAPRNWTWLTGLAH